MRTMPRFALTLIVLTGTLGATRAYAQPTVGCDTSPIIFGTTAAFSLKGGYQGWSQGQPRWDFQWVVGSCDTGFRSVGLGSNSISQDLKYPGTLTVRCTVQYNDGPGGHTQTFTPSASIKVPPPDGLRIISGDRVSKQGLRIDFSGGQHFEEVVGIECADHAFRSGAPL